MIRVENIKKTFNPHSSARNQVLKGVSFDLPDKGLVAIFGKSGSGKTTLLNILGGLEKADSGKITIDGEAMSGNVDRIRNQKIGFIFQKYHLIPTYNVLQNIVMPLLMRGMNLKEAKDASMDTIAMLGLAERIDHKPNELSGGQQQRVAIARALVGQPAILLADEPTGALDRNSGKEVLKLFQRLSDMGNTIVMITHDPHIASNAKRMVKIIDGEIFEGDEKEDAS
mgnify:CR=1 FL=1